MNLLRRLFLIYCLLIVSVVSAVAARTQYNVRFYDRWNKLPSDVLMKKGTYYVVRPEYKDSALVCFSVVANRYYNPDNHKTTLFQVASAMNNLGYLYFMFYFDYAKSYEYLTNALDLANRKNFMELLPFIYVNLGNLSCTSAALKAAPMLMSPVDYYIKGFDSALQTQQWNILMVCYANLLNQVQVKGMTKSAQRVIRQFKQLRVPPTTDLRLYLINFTQGIEAGLRGDNATALACYERAANKVDTKKTPERYRMVALSAITGCQLKMGRMADVIKSANEMLVEAKEYNLHDFEVDIYRYLSEVYKQMGDGAKAQHYDYLYLRSKEDFVNQSQLTNVKQQSFIRQLKSVNERVKEEARQRQRMGIALLLAVGIALVIAGILVVILRKNKRLREYNRQQYQLMQDYIAEIDKNREQKQRLTKTTEASESSKQPVVTDKYGSNRLDDNQLLAMQEKIEAVMNDTEEICSEQFSLSRLSELVGESSWAVSQAINACYKRNFNQLLAEYRVREVCRRLTDLEHYGNLTVEAVGASVGFRSRSSFFNTFKRVTGMKPGEYKKESMREG